jgi:hypothetical protein
MMDEYDLDVRLGIAESLAEDYRRLMLEAREALQAIYAMRGEDEFIANICSPLIDKLS